MGSTTNSETSASSYDKIDWDAQFNELQPYVALSAEEKEETKEIIRKNIRDRANSSFFGGSIGAAIQSAAYYVFALVQKFLTGKGAFTSIEDLKERSTTAADGAGKQQDLFKFQQAMIHAYTDLSQRGGNLAKAAEYITGQKLVTPGDNTAAQSTPHSVYNTLRSEIDLPIGTSAELNPSKLAYTAASAGENYAPSINTTSPPKSPVDERTPSA